VVTASIDRLDFIIPVRLGDVVVLQSQVNYVNRTSMEVGCRVETEHPGTRERVYTTKAYLTFVAIDGRGKPLDAPSLVLVSDTDERRFAAAQKRRVDRLRAVGRNS
jgi:acyl-CoA hydrolase